jgi:DeoR family transcriptional regulator, fructose operon transcriptional repressor
VKSDTASEQRDKLQAPERQKEIMNILSSGSEVKFNELSKIFGVTEMTIRRDIEKMEKKGLVRRTFGGAIISHIKDLTLKDRSNLMIEEKMKIGKLAASLIKEGEAVFIDSGTTTVQIARYLTPKSVNTVVTNSPQIALELQEKSISTILLGGQLLESSISLVGPIAEENLRNMTFDRAFIGATGFSVDAGLSNSNVFEIQIKKIAIQQSKEVNVVIDSSKFGVESLASFINLDGIDRLITGKQPDNEIFRLCNKSDVEILVP